MKCCLNAILISQYLLLSILMKDIRDSLNNNIFAKFLKDFYNKRKLEMPEGPI